MIALILKQKLIDDIHSLVPIRSPCNSPRRLDYHGSFLLSLGDVGKQLGNFRHKVTRVQQRVSGDRGERDDH